MINIFLPYIYYVWLTFCNWKYSKYKLKKIIILLIIFSIKSQNLEAYEDPQMSPKVKEV